MSDRPFKCQSCGNWYIQLPNHDGAFCLMCAEGTHAPRTHCHFGQTSATPSEIKMVELLGLCEGVRFATGGVAERIRQCLTIAEVKTMLAEVEQRFTKAELAQAEMPGLLQWATVMELPGMQGSPREARFKSVDAIRELVGTNRRPPEDLAMLERSGRVCREIAAEVPGVLSEARINLGQARQAAQGWQPPQSIPMPENVPSIPKVGKDGLTNAERMRKARAAKKPKELVAV